MRRNIENIKTLIKQMADNNVAVARHFEDIGQDETAQRFASEASALAGVLLAIESNESFNDYWNIFN